MRVRSRFLALAAGVLVVLAGCTGSPRASLEVTPSPVALVTPVPTGGSASPTVEPTTAVEPSSETPTVEPTLEPPPVAKLAVGGRAYAGKVGGYTWKTHGDSAPWLPATTLDAIAVSPGEHLTVKLQGAAVAGWTARVARAADTTGEDLIGLGQGDETIVVRAPRSGSWVLSVSIQYADDQGNGDYYWSVVVR